MVSGGVRPLRACGTRFIAHKVCALERIIDRFGAHLNHLVALIEDPKTKLVDRQKLKGYVTKWKDSKVLLGCAVFHDILKPAAILCKSFQADEISIVSTIEAILRTTAAMKKLQNTEMEDLPSVKKVILRLKHDATASSSSSTSSKTYQGVEITKLDQSLSFITNNYKDYIDSLLA